MRHLALYERERLVYCKSGKFGRFEFWVIRKGTVSPLSTRHKVRHRDIGLAVALFQNSPEGIKPIQYHTKDPKTGTGRIGLSSYRNDGKWNVYHLLDQAPELANVHEYEEA